MAREPVREVMRPTSLGLSLKLNLQEQLARHMAILCAAILSTAAALRLSQYIAMLALNIVNRSFVELLQPQLDYGQTAPPGFLLVQKLLTALLGNTDYVLRIFPLICGLASIWAMYALAKRLLVDRLSIIAAIALFAVSDRLIYYASEAKQYSSDVLICLLLLLAIARDFDRNLSNQDFVLLAALGTAALWFSHPALFILAGAGIALGANFLWKRDWRSTLKLGYAAGFWLVSLFLLYFIFLREQSARQSVLPYWNSQFFVLLPPWQHWREYIEIFRSVMVNPVGLPTKSTFALLVFGSISICARRWQFGLMLLLPISLTLLATALHEYPFVDRLVLFLVPIILLIVAEAVGRTCSVLNRLKGFPSIGLPVALAVLAWIEIVPAYHAARHLWKPRLAEEVKPIMSYLSHHAQANDIIYVYYGSAPAFRYYLPFYNMAHIIVVYGTKHREHPDRYFLELGKLRDDYRVWIVLSHDYTGNEKDMIFDYLGEIGGRLDQFNTYGAWLALYHL
jgi:uncharacterized membrane protein